MCPISLPFHRYINMPINESNLSKGQIRKLNALRKSVGDELAEDVFTKWLKRQESKQHRAPHDPVAETIAETLKTMAKQKSLHIGRSVSTDKDRKRDGKGMR